MMFNRKSYGVSAAATKAKIIIRRNYINIHTPRTLVQIIATILLLGKSTHCYLAMNQTANSSDGSKSSSGNHSLKLKYAADATGLNEIGLARNKCSIAERDLDKCSAQLIVFGQSDVQFPTTMEQLNSVYCPNVRRLTSCIKNSTNCYRPFERQVVNWILSSTRRINNKRCKNETEKQRFLKLSDSCFSLMKSSADKCMHDYVASLETISNLSPSEDGLQLQLTCCANKRFKKCVMNNAKQQCKPIEGIIKLKRTNSNSSQRTVQKYIQRAMLDMMEDLNSTLEGMTLTGPEFICKTVDEESCKAKFDGRYNSRVARHKSIVPAMLKIYSNK